MDRVRNRLRIKHYAKTTEKTYVYWILQYIYFHHKRFPAEMGKAAVIRFNRILEFHSFRIRIGRPAPDRLAAAM